MYASRSIRPRSQRRTGRYFTWAGHLARRDHMISEVASYRSLRWKAVVAALAPQDRQPWKGHQQRGRCISWDDPIHQFGNVVSTGEERR
eukprot:2039985-Alexandrium_andersonii.AAC.1